MSLYVDVTHTLYLGIPPLPSTVPVYQVLWWPFIQPAYSHDHIHVDPI